MVFRVIHRSEPTHDFVELHLFSDLKRVRKKNRGIERKECQRDGHIRGAFRSVGAFPGSAALLKQEAASPIHECHDNDRAPSGHDPISSIDSDYPEQEKGERSDDAEDHRDRIAPNAEIHKAERRFDDAAR